MGLESLGSDAAVDVQRHDSILVIEINRPAKRNAINGMVARGIAAALDELDADVNLSVGVIHGKGEYFSAGADLSTFGTDERPWAGDRGFGGIVERPSVKPLIAAVEGYALGGGFEIALACDLIVASRSAVFGLPEVKVGVAAAGGGLLRLSRVPSQVAMEMCLTGDPLPATRLHEVGLINQIVKPGSAFDHAMTFAGKIAPNAPLALAASKQVITECRDWPVGEMWSRQAGITLPVTESDDALEGVHAFLEKRRPNWRGQ